MNSTIISYFDWLLLPFYLLVILFIASNIKAKKITKNPIYTYFLPGLIAKIIGAICVCLIYVYYYKEGGDTLHYHHSATVMVNLLFESPGIFFNVWLGALKPENYFYFTDSTGYPTYWNDSNAYGVIRLVTPLSLFSFKSYIVTAVLVSVVCYSGIWRLYVLFCEQYPSLYKQFALTILFIPSVIFWGSGVLKDSWTIAAACWYCYSFYRIFIVEKQRIFHICTLVIACFILILIKPYIFIALLPGSILWGVWSRITSIKNLFVKILVVPLIVFMGISAGIGIWMLVGSELGDYSSIDGMVEKAYVSSLDLKQDYYQGNSFDLGEYDPTLSGTLSKFPIATITGLFRPFLWETKNIVMFLSGIENFIVLGFTIYVLLRRPITAIINLVNNPLVLFCLIFAVFFAFSVAISTSNFGAMVRLRIPLMPFYLSGLILIEYLGSRTKIKNEKVYYDLE